MRVVVGPMAVHVYFEYGTIAAQIIQSGHPVHTIEPRRMVRCVVRPESEKKEEPAKVLGSGFAVNDPKRNFNRIELRKMALWAALKDAKLERETRREIWQAYGKVCRLTSKQVKSKLTTPQAVQVA